MGDIGKGIDRSHLHALPPAAAQLWRVNRASAETYLRTDLFRLDVNEEPNSTVVIK